MKPIITFLKKPHLYFGITRYLLSLWMLTYAITKIMRTQFVIIPFSLYQRPLESLTGRNIAWAFLGYSPWFQVLLGVFELVPALLLLFRRTSLLGGILLLPVTLNVFLINHALNLWAGTKVIALIILALNIIVLLFKWKDIKNLINIVICKGFRYKGTWVETGINIILVAAVSWVVLTDLFGYTSQTNALTGDWLNKKPVEWTLTSEKRNDTTLKPRLLKSYFGAFGEYSELNDTGYVKRSVEFYELNPKKHTLLFRDAKNKLLRKYNYTLMGDTALQLLQNIDSLKGTKQISIFKKRVIVQNGD